MNYCKRDKVNCEWANESGECTKTACSYNHLETLEGKIDYYADLHTRKLRAEMEAVPDQTAKRDAGKLRISLVPPGAIESIARVRMYGITKYTDKDNWKRVEPERYVDAVLRHMMAVMKDMRSVDKESGLLHAEHALTNLGFLCAILRGDE